MEKNEKVSRLARPSSFLDTSPEQVKKNDSAEDIAAANELADRIERSLTPRQLETYRAMLRGEQVEEWRRTAVRRAVRRLLENDEAG